MSQENVEVVRGVRAPVTVSTESSQRTLDERILVRFPAFCRLLASVWSRLPPRVRRPWTARLVFRGCQAANRRDFELMSVFQDPEVEVEMFVSDRSGAVFPDMVGRLRGREAYRRLWGAVDEAYDDCRLEFDEFVDCGQRFLAGGRITGRGRHTGIALDQPIFQVFTHRRGLVLQEEDFDNRDRALEAVGLSE